MKLPPPCDIHATHADSELGEGITLANAVCKEFAQARPPRRERHHPEIRRIRSSEPVAFANLVDLSSETRSVFLQNHAQDVCACDLLPVFDLFFRPLYLFFVIERASRRVIQFGVTRSPMDEWVAQQLREATPLGQAPRFLIRDRDRKYGAAFTRVAVSTSIEVLKTPYRAPKANAVCERFLGRVRRECLDHMLVLEERPLYRVVRDYVTYFNRARPHQGIEQRIPEGEKSVWEKAGRGKIIAFPVLNRLHHKYQRAA